ncbi:carbamoyltransferase HypF [Anaeromyxobacter oryzisoli]|uniref:carbamoyltransferase HypF n=1 Tax=Anaeromyxobacter oryzisoli TaxID=2925408 RepID=UPI001F5A8119|nr:carbamoyltransferase HypF [Anaeromyxobacter sp. SG63]
MAAERRAPAPSAEGRRFALTGAVQGVGFRPFVYRLAHETGVTGRVWNDAAGVTIEAFGHAAALDRFADRLVRDRPPAAVVDAVAVESIPPEPAAGFEIAASGGAPERRVAIPPDLATCPDCLRELRDPANRRFRYPFTNCTSCGPRFTIALGAPYDRPATTMARFTLCPACAREYGDPLDRRFHAQPNACPVCGPRVEVRDAGGARVEVPDPVAHVAAALRAGAVAAVKGIGGYHLACDATSDEAVGTLRARKRREEKPLAVMVADLEAARALADLSGAEADLLASAERPIVLCRRRPGAPLAAGIAPDSPLVGLLLAYAPLHHLLLADAGRPLVMTSANLSDEPIAFEDDDALRRLRGIADVFLVHDRPIASRCDDSVARTIAGRPVVTRRARGFVPRPVRLARRFLRPVLAVGAQLKNACCLARGEEAVLGPHVGDLDGLETYAAFEGAIARLEAFLALRPEAIACDLHPLYLSTRYARERAAALGVPLVEVQHHHAHAAAAMAEHGLDGPVLALAWDGTGLGADGAAWGGELLLAEPGRFERLATFRPLALPGGDKAIRDPWRVALAALRDAFGDAAPLDALPLFAEVDRAERAVVDRMLAAGLNAPLAHGVGRAFDAAGALVLGRPRARYEGQLALALDNAAHGHDGAPYPFDLEPGPPERVDLRPAWRALVADVVAGVHAGAVSARFHATLVRAGAELVRRAARAVGRLPVVLTGGCFQNARLAEGLLGELDGAFEVYLHGQVPPGDGGLALGQALVADARARP